VRRHHDLGRRDRLQAQADRGQRRDKERKTTVRQTFFFFYNFLDYLIQLAQAILNVKAHLQFICPSSVTQCSVFLNAFSAAWKHQMRILNAFWRDNLTVSFVEPDLLPRHQAWLWYAPRHLGLLRSGRRRVQNEDLRAEQHDTRSGGDNFLLPLPLVFKKL
jgi:hypothetical protein